MAVAPTGSTVLSKRQAVAPCHAALCRVQE